MKQRMPWPRFRLRTCLIVVTIGSVMLALFVNRAQRQREAAQYFLSLGGQITMSHQVDSNGQPVAKSRPPGPPWLRRAIGAHYFETVSELNLRETIVADADLKLLRSLPALRVLNLQRTRISQLSSVGHNSKLKQLDLSETLVSDAELQHLVTLPSLEKLDLNATAISDAGASTLAASRSLSQVDLVGTGVTEKGVQALLRAGKQVICMLDLQVSMYDQAGKPLSVIKSDTPVVVRATYRVPLGATPNYRPLIFHIVGQRPAGGDIIMQSAIGTPVQLTPETYEVQVPMTVIGPKFAMPGRVELLSWKAIAGSDVRLEP